MVIADENNAESMGYVVVIVFRLKLLTEILTHQDGILIHDSIYIPDEFAFRMISDTGNTNTFTMKNRDQKNNIAPSETALNRL